MNEKQHEKYMKRCFELALQGKGKTSPNPMVGCVVLDKNEKVISEGYHKKYGEAHAERNALLKLNFGEHELEGEINMCQAVDELIEDGRIEARAEERRIFAIKLLKDASFSITKIAELTGLSEKDVESLKVTIA